MPTITEIWNHAPGRLALIYTFFLMTLLFSPVSELDPTPRELNLDKIVHLSAIAILYIMWLKTVSGRPRATTIAISICVGFSIFTETVQALIPYRSADIIDLIFDLLGIAIGVIFLKLIPNIVRKPALGTTFECDRDNQV